jgi:hypothetical protein
MQDKEYEFKYVIEALTKCGISTTKLEQLMDGAEYSDEFRLEDREKILLRQNPEQETHYEINKAWYMRNYQSAIIYGYGRVFAPCLSGI